MIIVVQPKLLDSNPNFRFDFSSSNSLISLYHIRFDSNRCAFNSCAHQKTNTKQINEPFHHFPMSKFSATKKLFKWNRSVQLVYNWVNQMHWWKTKTGQCDQSLENSILMAFMMICCYFHTYLFLKTGYKSFQFEYSRERKKCVFDWYFRRWFMPFNVDGLNRCIIYIENIVKLWLSCEESLCFFSNFIILYFVITPFVWSNVYGSICFECKKRQMAKCVTH